MARREPRSSRRKPATVHGVCIVDKPEGVTSHDVVAMLRRRLGERRVGHAGTLDPDATGVLVVGVGEATRLLRFVSDTDKRYTGEVVLGVETSTLDASGEVTATHDMSVVSIDDVRRAAARLTGEIEQVPPMVSAIKIDGVRLHELARRGLEVDRPPRAVTISRFDVEPASSGAAGVVAVDVECSSGTYVRTLAADLGRLLGGGAHLRNLRRLRVGRFEITEAAPPDECEVMAVRTAVRSLPEVTVDAETAAFIADGRVLDVSTFGTDAGPWAVFGPDGALLAVYQAFREGTAKPSVVLPSAGGR